MMRIWSTRSIVMAVPVALGVMVVSVAAQRLGVWPPPLQSVSSESPALSPDAALKTLVLPPGYRVELVASEPLIQDPVAIDWDADGRIWVVEMGGYMLDISASREHDPLGRIVVLEDINDDGRMDTRTVFADGLVLARAVKVLDRGVLVGEPPNLWLMKDTDGDLKADARELVTDTYGRREANVEHNANGLFWALDNRIYTSEVDMYVRLNNGRFEVHKTLARGQWGLWHDDGGRIYRNTNESTLYADLVPTPYYARNPSMTRTRGSYEFLGSAAGDINVTWPIRPTRGVNRGYQTGVLREDGSLASVTSVAAPTIYRGDRLPSDLYGNAFTVEPAGNLVSRIIIEDTASGLKGKKAYERGEFIASTDERFRPVYLSSAPDGTLYVVDMYRGVIQHRGYITEYLRDHILGRKLERPTAYGRLYRVVHGTTRRDNRPQLSTATAARLVEVLLHPNGWWRDTAQRLLVERGEKSAAPALRKLAVTAQAPRTRLHALWTLDGIDAIDAATVATALADPSRDVRAGAIRIAERWLRETDHALHAAVLALAGDTDWAVRGQLAASAGEFHPSRRAAALATMLRRYALEPVTADAAISGIRDSEAAVLELLLQDRAENPQQSAAITLVASAMVATRQDAVVQPLLDKVADRKLPMWQRAAVLRGAEVTLLGATAPGSPEGGRGRGRGGRGATEEPCPTCPGARGGPGGAPAFPRNTTGAAPPEGAGGRGGAAGGRGRGGAAGQVLRLTREPAIASLATDQSDLGKRAAAILARLEWPGKPGVAAVAPLTAQEQARFDAGRTVYQNLCLACHQADGRGREKVANSLVGSPFILATAGVPVRILLNGKEGPNGLMPPLGAAMDDEQIAAVLTYVRREWGNTATPIDGPAVAQIRKQVAGRTRPWTDAELAALAAGR
jgi:mono/diheme cytochrome c family protein